MLKKTEKTIRGLINGEEADIAYAVTPFPAMTAMRIAVKIAKSFGSGIGVAASGGVANVMDMDVSKLLDGILSSLDEEETPKLIADLLAKTERNGVFLSADVIDKVYTQNFAELMAAVKLSLEVNFGGFIAALAQAANTGTGQAPSEKVSP